MEPSEEPCGQPRGSCRYFLPFLTTLRSSSPVVLPLCHIVRHAGNEGLAVGDPLAAVVDLPRTPGAPGQSHLRGKQQRKGSLSGRQVPWSPLFTGTLALLWVHVPGSGKTKDLESRPRLGPGTLFSRSRLKPRQVEQVGGAHKVTPPHGLLSPSLFPCVSCRRVGPSRVGPHPPATCQRAGSSLMEVFGVLECTLPGWD